MSSGEGASALDCGDSQSRQRRDRKGTSDLDFWPSCHEAACAPNLWPWGKRSSNPSDRQRRADWDSVSRAAATLPNAGSRGATVTVEFPAGEGSDREGGRIEDSA